MSVIMIISYRFSSNKDINVEARFILLTFALGESWIPVLMYSCIILETLRSMDLFILLPNLLHSMVISVWSACSMSVCIRASLFIVRLFVGGLAVLKEEDLLSV